MSSCSPRRWGQGLRERERFGGGTSVNAFNLRSNYSSSYFDGATQYRSIELPSSMRCCRG